METPTVSDGVTDDEPFSGPHVLIPHGRELCLEGDRSHQWPDAPQNDIHVGALFRVKEERR